MSTHFFVFEGNRRVGPYDQASIYSFYMAGQLRTDSYVQAADTGQYLQVQEVLNVGMAPGAAPSWGGQNYGGQPGAPLPPQGATYPPPAMGGQPGYPAGMGQYGGMAPAAPGFSPAPAAGMGQYGGMAPAAPGFSPAPAAGMGQYGGMAPAAPGFSPAPAAGMGQYGGMAPAAPGFSPAPAAGMVTLPAEEGGAMGLPGAEPAVMVQPLEEEKVFPAPQMSMRKWYDRTNPDNGNVVCPHCWGHCSLESLLYVSSHPELTGDAILGEDALCRFLPKYYTSKGTPLDAKGMETTDMACPYCHLKIPNSVVDLPSSFFSIVGAPASGKSYFLTSMIWRLRTVLPGKFHFSFFDTDPSFNMVLNEYEKLIFMNPDSSHAVSLPKTELQGTGYSSQVSIEGNALELPMPFVFTMAPLESHPEYARRKRELERGITFYDNAGEHFEVGRNTTSNLASLHLLHSDGIIFFYDPLKDVRMKEKCSQDAPQVTSIANYLNQNTFFTEMASRIRKQANLQANEKFSRPLIVVVPKFDSWRETFPLQLEGEEYIAYDENGTACMEMGVVTNVSFCLRRMLLKIAPEIVGLAEAFAEKVYFIPVSALGRLPEYDPLKGMIGVRPEHIQPLWVEVPFLLLLYLNGLLVGGAAKDDSLPKVQDFHFLNGKVTFNFPGGTERFTLPDYYCGTTLYNEEDGKHYSMPEPPEHPLPPPQGQEAASGNDAVHVEDMDFWEK